MKKQVLLFVLMLMPLVASAQIEIDGIWYNLYSSNKVAEVSRGFSEYTGRVNIPNTVAYGGITYTVTRICNGAFEYCSNLTFVEIPNSVRSIGNLAFQYCTSLTSVEIPNSVTSIGERAFTYCTSLSTVEIPNSVTIIYEDAFIGCDNIQKITFYCQDIKSWFKNVKSIKEVIIGEGVKSISAEAFLNCSGLTSVVIPNSMTSIGEKAFLSCSSLTSIILGRGIETIDRYAFAYCESLEDVYCHAEKVPSTEINAFDGSYISYATLHVPENSINQYRRREPWSGFETITGILEDENNDGDRCEKPVITILANGKVKVECATEGATCVTNITASNAEPLSDEEISLNTPLIVYTVTSYATKEGYNDSEVATATFRYEKAEGDINGDGNLNISDVVQLVNMILGQ